MRGAPRLLGEGTLHLWGGLFFWRKMSDSALSDKWNARHLPDKGIDMKKLTRKVSFRVTEEMGDWMDEVGSDVVRQAMLEKMHPMVVVEADLGDSGIEEVPKALPGAKVSDKVVVGAEPVWKAKLAAQLAEREKRGFSVLPGSAAPVAVAAVSAPSGEGRVAPGTRYAPMRGRTEEERAEALAKVGGLKLMPQMEKKAEFYPDDEPNEEP